MIYLLRHGQTEFNAAGRYQGRVDTVLTDRGRAQADAMARGLVPHVAASRSIIWSSPLRRATETAGIVAAALGGLPVRAEPRLTEVDLGVWEGLTAAEIDAGWPGVRASFERNTWFFGAPGGENYAEVADRLIGFLREIGADERPHVLVSHAIAGRVLRGIHAGLEPLRAMRLEIPQDAVFRLSGAGKIERIDCPAAV